VTVAVVLGGAVGAPLRYLTDLLVQVRRDSMLPWGTLSVNVVGSLTLGPLVSAVVNAGAPTLAGTGFRDALTTSSTFWFESVWLIEDGSWLEALVNVSLSLGVGLLACAGGWTLVEQLA
jgi:CrcB protein